MIRRSLIICVESLQNSAIVCRLIIFFIQYIIVSEWSGHFNMKTYNLQSEFLRYYCPLLYDNSMRSITFCINSQFRIVLWTLWNSLKYLNFDHFAHTVQYMMMNEWSCHFKTMCKVEFWDTITLLYDNSMKSTTFCINTDRQSTFSIKLYIRKGRIRPNSAKFGLVLHSLCTLMMCNVLWQWNAVQFKFIFGYTCPYYSCFAEYFSNLYFQCFVHIVCIALNKGSRYFKHEAWRVKRLLRAM